MRGDSKPIAAPTEPYVSNSDHSKANAATRGKAVMSNCCNRHDGYNRAIGKGCNRSAAELDWPCRSLPSYLAPTLNPAMKSHLPRFFRSLLCLSCCLVVSMGRADERDQWLTFRGNDGYGKAEGTLPNQWSDKDYLWRYQTPSRDVGSMTVADGKVFLLVHKPKDVSGGVASRFTR